MKSGYEVIWADFARSELAKTYKYLEENFSEKELRKLSQEIENVIGLISKNPNLFPLSSTKNVHKVVIKRFNTMYYWKKGNKIEILSFFSNRQNPKKRKY